MASEAVDEVDVQSVLEGGSSLLYGASNRPRAEHSAQPAPLLAPLLVLLDAGGQHRPPGGHLVCASKVGPYIGWFHIAEKRPGVVPWGSGLGGSPMAVPWVVSGK